MSGFCEVLHLWLLLPNHTSSGPDHHFTCLKVCSHEMTIFIAERKQLFGNGVIPSANVLTGERTRCHHCGMCLQYDSPFPQWEPDKITMETDFVLGVNVNK